MSVLANLRDRATDSYFRCSQNCEIGNLRVKQNRCVRETSGGRRRWCDRTLSCSVPDHNLTAVAGSNVVLMLPWRGPLMRPTPVVTSFLYRNPRARTRCPISCSYRPEIGLPRLNLYDRWFANGNDFRYRPRTP